MYVFSRIVNGVDIAISMVLVISIVLVLSMVLVISMMLILSMVLVLSMVKAASRCRIIEGVNMSPVESTTADKYVEIIRVSVTLSQCSKYLSL